MSEMALLLGLLVVSYLGSILLSGRALRGYGLPSGTEWVVLGFLLGPYCFAVVPSDAWTGFAPMAAVAAAWVTLAMGAEYGYAGQRRASWRGVLLGIVFGMFTAAVVSGAVFATTVYVTKLSTDDAWLIAAGVGLASSETTRHAVRWVTERGVISTPLLVRIEEIADTDEIIPLLGMALLFASLPGQTSVSLSFSVWLAVTAAVGIGLGVTCAMLISTQPGSEAWSVLLGAALLGTGIAWRLDISPLTVMFVMGLVLSVVSRHRVALREMLARTESPVLLPMLLLGGALVRFDARGLGWTIAAALLGRTFARGVLGYFLGWANGLGGGQRVLLGFGMSSSGAVTMLLGLAFAFRFPGVVGSSVLCTAACMTGLGELLGPGGLRRALGRSEPPPPPAAATPVDDAAVAS